jgi:hypothetical protein
MSKGLKIYNLKILKISSGTLKMVKSAKDYKEIY